MIIIPTITGYGSSFGKFKGNMLRDYELSGSNDPTELNKNSLADGVEFNKFEEYIKDYVMAQLGHPIVRVELTTFQIKTCIDEAITKLSYHAPQWMMQFASFNTSAGYNLYELPAVIINNLNDVWYRKNLLTSSFAQGTLEYDIFLNFFSRTKILQDFSMSDYFIMQQYLEVIRRVLGQDGSWDIINNKYLQLYPTPSENEGIVLEFRALDTATVHPAYLNWVQRYTLACAKGVLGRIRGKFEQLPGPGIGSKLDGAILRQESLDEKDKLMEELLMEIEGPALIDIG